MFLHLSVILFTDGVSGRRPPGRHTHGQTYPLARPPPQQMTTAVHSMLQTATAVDSTHPTGMYSCLVCPGVGFCPRVGGGGILVQQECIPVGCVLSAAVAVCPGGLSATPTLPCEQNDRLVKTLPCSNYVADGNNYKNAFQ